MRYNSLIQTKPRSWKRIPRTPEDPAEMEEEGDYKLIDKLMNSDHPTRILYSNLVGRKICKPTKAI